MMQKATRQQLKSHNEQLVLGTIFHHSPGLPVVSRAELSRLTGLTKTTISEIVGELIETGLVAETGLGVSVGGKPPTLLQPNPNARQVICLDLGSAEFHGALSNLSGELLHRINIPVKDLKGEVALNRVFVLIDSLRSAASAPLLGIGIGTPGLVNAQEKTILQAVNLEWKDLALGAKLTQRYDCPIYLQNDSHAAAIAEYTYGTKNVSNNLILIKSGQGIGAGIIINGEIFDGNGFGSGEIGHVQVVENGLPCTCGKSGCLETVASNRAIISQALSSGRIDRQQANRPEHEVFLLLTEAYRRGDKVIQNLVHDTGRHFGNIVSNLAIILNIQQIVIGGPITTFGSILMEGIQKQIQQQVFPSIAHHIQVSFSKLEDDSVMLGAGALVVSKELGIHA